MKTTDKKTLIKRFAGKQHDYSHGDYSGLVTVESRNKGIDVCDPWVDSSGRVRLSDSAAEKEYGTELVQEFCRKAEPYASGYTVWYEDSSGAKSRKLTRYDTKQAAVKAIYEDVAKRQSECGSAAETQTLWLEDGTKVNEVICGRQVSKWIRMW